VANDVQHSVDNQEDTLHGPSFVTDLKHPLCGALDRQPHQIVDLRLVYTTALRVCSQRYMVINYYGVETTPGFASES